MHQTTSWIKQTLKIKHFLGTSENAVRIQIAVVLISCLLLRRAYAVQTAVEGLLAFTRLVRANSRAACGAFPARAN